MRPCFPMIFMCILLVSPASGEVIINEIMYSPSPEFGGTYNEWVEIYNNGSEERNLSGWTFTEISKNHTLYGIIAPSDFLILARKPENFTQYYAVSAPIIEAKFQLSDSGEELFLRDSAGNIIDGVKYVPLGNATGSGKSIERSESLWHESAVFGGTPGAPNSVLIPADSPAQNNNAQTENQTGNNDTFPQPSQPQQNDMPQKIEILRSPQSMKFGDFSSVQARFYSGSRSFSKMRFVAYVFSPSWIARDLMREETTIRKSPYNSLAAVEISDVPENATENIALPMFLKCRSDYAEGRYTIRVRGYYLDSGIWSEAAEKDAHISVSGENDMCKAEKCENKTVYVNRTIPAKEKCSAEPDATVPESDENEEALRINITAPQTVFIGKNFTTNALLGNNGTSPLDLEIYSYLYEHSAVMSQGWTGEKWGNARTANGIKVSLAPGNSTMVELPNMPRENITPEKYTFKVRIDDLNDVKKSEERVFLVNVAAAQEPERINPDMETKNASLENKITAKAIEKSGKNEESFWGKIMRAIKRLLKKDA